MNPREIAARQRKVDALVNYLSFLGRKTEQLNPGFEATPAGTARMVRKLEQEERDQICRECGINKASEITWGQVIDNFDALAKPDELFEQVGRSNVYNIGERWGEAS